MEGLQKQLNTFWQLAQMSHDYMKSIPVTVCFSFVTDSNVK